MSSTSLRPRPVPYGQPGHVPAPITRRVDDVALVFEGGGMRGTYTAALVQVLLEAGLFFPWVGGISAGCTNTVNMVSRDLWRTREAFVGLTTDPRTGGWGSFVRRQGYFNSEHIYRHTSAPDESIPFDWPVFKSTEATVRIGSFRCDTGEEVYWGLEDVDELADLLPRCQASSSMPLLMPIVRIDGVPYLDGALGPTGGFATDAAAADGYERMLVVSTRPAGYRKPDEKRPGAYRRFFRRYPAVAEGIVSELQPDHGGARGRAEPGARLPLPARPHGDRQWRAAVRPDRGGVRGRARPGATGAAANPGVPRALRAGEGTGPATGLSEDASSRRRRYPHRHRSRRS